MRIGGWSELSIERVWHEVMREVHANETSGELGSAFSGTLVGLSQLSIPKFDPLIESSILFPLVSVDLEYHDGWCVLKSPRIGCPVSSEDVLLKIDTHYCKSWLEGYRCLK